MINCAVPSTFALSLDQVLHIFKLNLVKICGLRLTGYDHGQDFGTGYNFGTSDPSGS